MNDELGTTRESKETASKPYQFSMRVLFLLPVGISLPFAVSYLADDPLPGCLVLLGELVVGSICRPTRIVALPTLGLLLLVALLLPTYSSARAPARTSQCTNNMKQIALALYGYHDAYGCFPPAYVADEDGRPMHSWRVLILPFFEQAALYDQYCFDEPWDGPNNSQLADSIPYGFNCPSEPGGRSVNTNYVLITGEDTAWADGRAPRLADFTDDPAKTIMVVEVADSGIPWMEPRDLTVDQAMRGINSELGLCISSWHPTRGSKDRQESAHVTFADSMVVNLKNNYPVSELRKLLTRQGGEPVVRPK
jgi:Protein of unknown function (DUF1559)